MTNTAEPGGTMAKGDRLLWRDQGKTKRAYGDFRDFEDVGGGREALKPAGRGRALAWDPDLSAKENNDLARKLLEKRLEELKDKRRGRIEGRTPEPDAVGLAEFAAHHLEAKAREGEVTDRWIASQERHLEKAVAFFGRDRDVASITPKDLGKYVTWLSKRDNNRGGTFTKATQRKYLNTLSDLFSRAVHEELVPANPVAGMYKDTKPSPEKTRPTYFQPHEVALLLESARTYRAPVEDGGFAYMYPLLATFALTGGRKSEVLGLEVDDVSFKLGKVFFRPNGWRRLKSHTSERHVPLWPQLEEILRAYLLEREREGGLGKLLFPSARGPEDGPEKMIRDVRKALDRIGGRVGFPAGEVRLHALRHSYCAARLQTLENGAPVSVWQVAHELGHKSARMIEDRYGHLADAPNRSETVSFRVEDHREKIGDKVHAL